ncbi:uncharacterized protein N0V96_011400 [Colletotrichum fioriniae]|uniref:uncharacterized protein n=1 Tax=Colletotrichum fioriniae TaxID=710243 RepID=UPI0032DB1A7D|nr:hypothetical protein N0V96_011400 [Colletotrichum fioriniae]
MIAGPAIYTDIKERDNYWTVVFEVPYILWAHYCLRPYGDPDHGAELDQDSADYRSKRTHQVIEEISNGLGDLTVRPARSIGPQYHYEYWMKQDLPLNKEIEDDEVVELQDEWLYDEPTFFVNATNANAERYAEVGTKTGSLMVASTSIADHVLMIDVPKQTMLDELHRFSFPVKHLKDKEQQDLTFREVARSQRKAGTAKKRFWAFVSRNAEQNLGYIETFAPSEREEKAEMKRFLQRHEFGSNFFAEQTTAVLNRWTTEFHLTFCSGVKASKTPENSKKKWHDWTTERVSMGFRFEGDFFDRYWTCRFVVADPQMMAEEEIKKDLIKFLEQDSTDEARSSEYVETGPWEQRRVLELMLFGRVIRHMNESADGILRLAKNTVKEQTTKLMKKLQSSQESEQARNDSTPDESIDYKNSLLASNEFRKFQAELRMIHGDFIKVMATIQRWLNRVKDRQAERPQWTLHNEIRYRSTLNKLMVANHRGIEDLELNLAEISSLSESITRELEYVRSYLEIMANDQSRQNSNDVRLFTYVTAIFLPLGFATGMFSMSGTPDAQTVGGMFGLFVGVFILGLAIIISVAKVNARYGDSRQIREKLIRWGWQKIDRAYLLRILIILILIVGKVNTKELINRGRQKMNGTSLRHAHEASAERKSTEETNAERKEDVTDKASRRRFCGLKIHRKQQGGALAKRKEEHVEEGRGVFGVPRMDETATSGSVQSFKG